MASVTLARFAVVGRRSPTSPRSSAWLSSGRAWAIHGNAASIVAGVSRTPGQDLACEGARRREGPVQRVQRAGRRCAGRRAAGGSCCGGSPTRPRSTAIVRVEVGDEVLELALVDVERLGDDADVPDDPRQVVRLGPQERVVDDRGGAEGVARVLRGAVEGLRPRQPLDLGILTAVVGGGRLGRSAPCRSRRARPGGRSRVSDCSAVRIWSSWTGSAVCVIGTVSPLDERRRARGPGLEVDEEVSLEEDPRADLHRRRPCGSAGRTCRSPS